MIDIGNVKVEKSPFPHIVVHDFLPPKLYQELSAEYPSDEIITAGKPIESNTRYQISAAEIIRQKKLHPVWLDFVKYFVSPDWWQKVLNVFKESILREHPDIDLLLGRNLEELTIGVRSRDLTDVVLDCQPGINSPVLHENSVRGPHVDNPVELFGGLLYFRLPEDDSVGGDLILYKHKNKNPVFWGKAELRENDVEVSRKVPYRANTLVLFVNSLNAVHGVSPRAKTQHSRRLVNIIGEVCQGGGLFNLPRDRSYLGKARNRWYQYLYGW